MIKIELKRILVQAKKTSSRKLYLRNLLKEYLQTYVLFYIYTTDKYKEKLIFTGGTCLRHFYGLSRLSEDLDFDCVKMVNTNQLGKDLSLFFKKKYRYSELVTSVKQEGKQILLKFPVLKDLGLSEENESDWLYVKIDLNPNPSKKFNAIMSTKSLYGFNFIARHYDLPNLMAGKINAIFQRDIYKGKNNRKIIKGRDYFDLLWYLKKGIKPNMAKIRECLNKPNLTFIELGTMLDKKVNELRKKFMAEFKNDLLPLIRDSEFVEVYIENYFQEYKRAKKSLTSK